MSERPPEEPDPAIRDFVGRLGLVADPEHARFIALTGGVSSDIWMVEDDRQRFCVKRALAKLRVKADWRAPVERNAYEAAWLKGAAQLAPGWVPKILAEDAEAGMFAMEYLPRERYRSWKADLLAGRVDFGVASAVGHRLAKIHSAFAGEPDAAERFATDASFHAIRLEPYLIATGRAHPDLAEVLGRLADRTAGTKRTVVHGDVSPKNILVGPNGPVFLDAECAWFGDPAFDLAFCLNHMLLKCLAAPAAAGVLLGSFRALASSYLAKVDWEDAGKVEARAATLLPGLFLARVDGKSPVEYVTAETEKERVRHTARRLLTSPSVELQDIADDWAREIGWCA